MNPISPPPITRRTNRSRGAEQPRVTLVTDDRDGESGNSITVTCRP